MVRNRFLLIVGLFLCLGGSAFANEPDYNQLINECKEKIIKKTYGLQEFNARCGLPRSTCREVSEQTLLAILHNSIDIIDGKVVIDLKKGLTKTRDGMQKFAVYELLHKAIAQGLEKGGVKTPYKTSLKPWVDDGLDVVFRGIKYSNDESKEQTLTAFFKDDFGPYMVKKKTVWLARKIVHSVARKTLERYEYGRIGIASYELLRMVPLIGIELEELSRKALEHLYDKGLDLGKKMFNTYIPKIKPHLVYFQPI